MGAADYILFEIPGTAGDGIDYGSWCSERADWYRDQYLANATSSTQQTVTTGTWERWAMAGGVTGWEGPYTSAVSNHFGGNSNGGYEWWSEWCIDTELSVFGSSGIHLCHAILPGRTGGGEGWPDNPAATGTQIKIRVGTGGASRAEVCGF